MSLLKSELGAFFRAVSLQASCAFLWDPGKKLLNYILFFQQSIYFPHCFALITVGTEWFSSGVFSCRADNFVWRWGVFHMHFPAFYALSLTFTPEFQWSRCTRSEITPWVLVICIVGSFIGVCKKTLFQLCMGLCVCYAGGFANPTERTPSP